MGHGYVFSMTVRTIGEGLEVFPFLLGNEQLILRGGGGWQFFKINILKLDENKYCRPQKNGNKYSD